VQPQRVRIGVFRVSLDLVVAQEQRRVLLDRPRRAGHRVQPVGRAARDLHGVALLWDPAGLFRLGGEGEVEAGEVACSCAVQGMAGPVGVEADHVDRGGEVVLEPGFGQSEVAGAADSGDVGGLAHGALDAGAGGVAGFPLCGGLLGAGGGERFVQVAGRSVIWRRLRLVHSWRAGQGMQALFGQDTTMASPSFFRHGVQELLAVPCGQVAWRASKSMEKAAFS